MLRNLLLMYLLGNFLFFSLGHAEERFSWLEDIKIAGIKSSWNFPVIVARPDGGYIIFWAQRGEPPEELAFPPEYYYYRIIDAKGKIVVNRKELKFWRVASRPTYWRVALSSKSILWLDTTQLLIIAWKSFGPHYHVYKLERIIMNLNGEIVAGPDALGIGGAFGPDAVLVKDNKGRVYAVDYGYVLKTMQVYPEFGKVKSMALQKQKQFHKKYPAHTFAINSPVTITSDHKLLICNRLNWEDASYQKTTVWQLRPDKFFYVLVDLDCNFISASVALNIGEYAFRKIPGIHLGGYYYAPHKIRTIEEAEAASEDLDLSRLPNGDIILSITGEDETGKLCVYQVKFNPEGKIEKPKHLETVNPLPFPKESVLPVVKVVFAQSVQDYLTLIGFDEEGNFYGEREVWQEGEE